MVKSYVAITLILKAHQAILPQKARVSLGTEVLYQILEH